MRALSSLCPRITQGSLLLFNKCLLLNVEAVKKYNSFSEMLQAEIISNVLPGISSIEEGVKVQEILYGGKGKVLWSPSNICFKAISSALHNYD